MALQHLRSSTASKRPTPAAMSDGQLAINTNTASPGLFFKDSAGALIKVGPVHVGTTAPNVSPASGGETGNTVGEQWLDTTGGTYVFKVWDGSAWRSETGTFVDVNGDTMTGALGIIAGSASTPGLFFSGDTNTGIYSPGADELAISTNGTGRLFVASDGKIGIGSSGSGTQSARTFIEGSGACPLEIDATAASGGYLTLSNSGAAKAFFGFGSNIGTASVNDVAIRSQSGALAFQTNGANERLRITSDGKVGLGTSSADGMLHVKGANTHGSVIIEAGGTSGTTNQIFLQGHNNAGTAIGEIAFDETATNQGGLSFKTNGGSLTTKMTLTSGGSLGVGTTSPSYQLELSTDSAGKPSTNTWTIVSDERIKEEIELADLDLCYEAVKNIPLKRFKWKDEVYTEEQAYDRHKLGWIAQDVETVFPKAVRQHEFKYNQVFEEIVVPAVPEELDDDGNVVTEAQPEHIGKGELISEEVIEDCRNLNSDQIYAAMYGAIQKLINKVETLEAEVIALKTP